MFRNIKNWLERRRNERIRRKRDKRREKINKKMGFLNRPVTNNSTTVETGVEFLGGDTKLLKYPKTNEYLISEYGERGHSQNWYTSVYIAPEIGEKIIQFPEMILNYKCSRPAKWVTPNTDSIDHPARVNTKVWASPGYDLFARLESVGIADHANGTQIMRDPLTEKYWFWATKMDDGVQWHDLTSLNDFYSKLMLKNPEHVLSLYNCASGKKIS